LRLEHYFSALRRSTACVPTLLQVVYFNARVIQQSVISNLSLHSLLKPVTDCDEKTKAIMQAAVQRCHNPARQQGARTPRAPAGTLPAAVRYNRSVLPWIEKNTVVAVKSECESWLARVDHNVCPNDTRCYVTWYENEGIGQYKLGKQELIFTSTIHDIDLGLTTESDNLDVPESIQRELENIQKGVSSLGRIHRFEDDDYEIDLEDEDMT